MMKLIIVYYWKYLFVDNKNFIRKIKNSIKMNFYNKNSDEMMELCFLQKWMERKWFLYHFQQKKHRKRKKNFQKKSENKNTFFSSALGNFFGPNLEQTS